MAQQCILREIIAIFWHQRSSNWETIQRLCKFLNPRLSKYQVVFSTITTWSEHHKHSPNKRQARLDWLNRLIISQKTSLKESRKRKVIEELPVIKNSDSVDELDLISKHLDVIVGSLIFYNNLYGTTNVPPEFLFPKN